MAVVYSREIDGKIIRLTPSGWTYGSDASASVFVLTDYGTGSIWFPAGNQTCTLPQEFIGEAACGLVGVGGTYADHVLTGIQTLSMTTWAEWKREFPDTKYVTARSGYE